MLISELEAQLKDIREEHGDLPCYRYDSEHYHKKIYVAEVQDKSFPHPNLSWENSHLPNITKNVVVIE